jgi:transcriptional regulator with XRE-family HTH domain
MFSELAGINPTYTTFKGTEQEAWDYVSATNVDGTRHINNKEKEFFYVQRAEALGVRRREDSLKQNSTDTSNDATVPSQENHADSIGVSRPTITRWERDRREIKSDPELAAKAVTPEGYQEAKAEVKRRRVVVPDYRVDDAMGAIKGISEAGYTA